MGKISINLSDEDKQKLQREAKRQHKSLSELCRERILNSANSAKAQNETAKQIDEELAKNIMTISKNIMFLYNEVKNSEQTHNQIKKQTYYNSSYLYFLAQELFPDQPNLANEIDKKIQATLQSKK